MTTKVYEATAPSNIAFLKYWGKSDSSAQWPSNNSLSMTLSNCVTQTKAFVIKGSDQFELFFDGEEILESSFRDKVVKFLTFLKNKFSFEHYLRIDTRNSFPTASGIASSASGFAALTLAALAAWNESESLTDLENHGLSREVLADLARLGSGSACRSLFLWYCSLGQRFEP